MHSYIMHIYDNPGLKGIYPKLARLKDVADRLERACKRQKDLLDLQDRAQKLRASVTGADSVCTEIDNEIVAINVEQDTLVQESSDLDSELTGLEVQIREMLDAIVQAGEPLASWQPLIDALGLKMPELVNRGDCLIIPNARLFFIKDILSRLNDLLRTMDVDAAYELIRKPEPVRPPFSGWYFRADIGEGRESTHPIFGDVIIGHKQEGEPIEIITDPKRLASYFETVRRKYARKKGKEDLLGILAELEKRTSCGVFFRDSNAISTLHGLIEIRAGIKEATVFLHAFGVNPVELRRSGFSQLINAPLKPLTGPMPLASDDIISLVAGTPFSVKVYQSSLVVHSLLVSCDSRRMYPDHFESELIGVKSELDRFSQFGTHERLIGETATIKEFENRLLSYRALPENATLVIVINMHGSPHHLSFINGDLRKDRLIELLGQIPCKKLLIVNACHAGGFWDKIERIPPKTLIASSSKREQVTYGGTFLHEVAAAFAKGEDLKKLDGIVLYGGFNGRTHEAGVDGATIMIPRA